MPQFHIRIANDDLVFSAGHFITLAQGQCERLHGHTYRVAAEVHGPLDENQCVVDFLAVHNALKAIAAELDHRMLLPTQHPAIRVSSRMGAVEVTFADRRWVFPEDDCMLLPIVNTTTEMLAQYVGERLQAALAALGGCTPSGVRVEIGEGAGAAAVCELP
ncbi:MAG: 6-carboxytetrahydropterin synthase [Planctomycetota bacterium]|nr:6-carboxytetrahydropterin synthase [Planctomycetota bacterium]